MKGNLLRKMLLYLACSLFFSTVLFARNDYAVAKEDTSMPVKTAAAAGAAQKAALLKKIGALLSFRKNIQKRQKELINKTIAEQNFPDSIRAVSLQLQSLIDTMSFVENEHYSQLIGQVDSLFDIVKKRDSSVPFSYSLLPDEDRNIALEPSGKEVKNIAPVSRIDTESSSKQKNETVALIKKIATEKLNPFDSISTDQAKDGTGAYHLHRKADICGYYNANSNFDYNHTDLRFLSTLIYDSLFTITLGGHLQILKEWKKDLVDVAKKDSCSVIYTIHFTDKKYVSAFLSDRQSIENFTEDITSLQKDKIASGININFGNIESYNKDLFTGFIQYFRQLRGMDSSSFKIYLTLPVYDEQNAYDIKSLSPFVNMFCIDFSSNRLSHPAPLAPLTGKEPTSLSTSLSYYLNQEVTPEKFMVNFGYQGVKWLIYDNKKKPGIFLQYMTYAIIRNKTDAAPMYDSLSHSVFIDTQYANNIFSTRIWFDDENTLADKYDYISQNGLGGVGFSYLGYDGVYGDLWDALLYKFIQVDSVHYVIPVAQSLSSFQKLYRRLVLYNYILHNPCETCFDSSDLTDSLHLRQYITELKIDSLAASFNAKEKKKYSRFGYITKEMNTAFLFVTVFFLLLLSILAFVYVHYTKEQGDRWKYKKATGWTLTVLSVFFLWSLFDYLFTTSWFPFFGVNDSLSADDAKYCNPDSSCINMPLNTLLEIIVVASVVGFLLTRYLLAPLLKKEDVP